MMFRITIIFLFVISTSLTISAQSRDKVNFIFAENQYNIKGMTKSKVTIRRNADNPLLSFGDAIYEQSMNGNLKVRDNFGNTINASKLKEILVVVDTAITIDYDTYEETITVTENFLSGADFDGCELDITLNVKGNKISSNLNAISPFILNGKQPRAQKVFSISTSSGCKKPDFGYLISANLDGKKHPQVIQYLYDVINGKSIISSYDSRLKPLSRDLLEENMFQMDTSIVINYNTYEESVQVTRSEVHQEDLDVAILGELTFCSRKGKFDFKLKAIGCSYDVIHPKTGAIMDTRSVFFIKTD